MQAKTSPSGRLRTLVILGRTSNLPTVWSNCLAAWVLGGGGSWGRFAQLAAGATLLYTGGMFLNDACDARFDQQYRPERPIPRGQISRRAVSVWAAGWLAAGTFALAPLGMSAAVFALALLAGIVIYDGVHKRMAFAPLLMAGCRFLLYCVAASAAQQGTNAAVLWHAFALAAYVTGLSCLARGESKRTEGGRGLWPVGLLPVPIVVALLVGALSPMNWILAAGCGAWVVWCLRDGLRDGKRDLSGGVAGLLAGIVLVDWLAAAGGNAVLGPVFAGLFLLALIWQRAVPAT